MQNNAPWRKQLTFFSLYIAQSVPMSLISTLLPVLMRQENFSLKAIGLLQLIKLPWILKLLWAPLVDRHTADLKSYKRWIWSSEIAYALCLIVVAFLNLELHFHLILTLVVIAFASSATQDIATDALTSRSFKGETLRANRLQSMGQFAGTILGGGLLVILYKYIGWTMLFSTMAILVIVLLIPLHRYNAPQLQQSAEIKRESVGLQDIVSFFHQKSVGQRVILLIIFNLGIIGTMTMMKPYLVDQQYETEEIGILFSLYGAGMGFLGSMLLSRIKAKVIHIKQRLIYTSTLILFASIIIALLATFKQTGLIAMLISLGLLWSAYGTGTVMIYTLAMEYVRPGREGTDFTLQIVILHLSSVLIAGISGFLTQHLGYPNFFILEAIIALTSFLYIRYKL